MSNVQSGVEKLLQIDSEMRSLTTIVTGNASNEDSYKIQRRINWQPGLLHLDSFARNDGPVVSACISARKNLPLDVLRLVLLHDANTKASDAKKRDRAKKISLKAVISRQPCLSAACWESDMRGWYGCCVAVGQAASLSTLASRVCNQAMNSILKWFPEHFMDFKSEIYGSISARNSRLKPSEGQDSGVLPLYSITVSGVRTIPRQKLSLMSMKPADLDIEMALVMSMHPNAVIHSMDLQDYIYPYRAPNTNDKIEIASSQSGSPTTPSSSSYGISVQAAAQISHKQHKSHYRNRPQSAMIGQSFQSPTTSISNRPQSAAIRRSAVRASSTSKSERTNLVDESSPKDGHSVANEKYMCTNTRDRPLLVSCYDWLHSTSLDELWLRRFRCMSYKAYMSSAAWDYSQFASGTHPGTVNGATYIPIIGLNFKLLDVILCRINASLSKLQADMGGVKSSEFHSEIRLRGLQHLADCEYNGNQLLNLDADSLACVQEALSAWCDMVPCSSHAAEIVACCLSINSIYLDMQRVHNAQCPSLFIFASSKQSENRTTAQPCSWWPREIWRENWLLSMNSFRSVLLQDSTSDTRETQEFTLAEYDCTNGTAHSDGDFQFASVIAAFCSSLITSNVEWPVAYSDIARALKSESDSSAKFSFHPLRNISKRLSDETAVHKSQASGSPVRQSRLPLLINTEPLVNSYPIPSIVRPLEFWTVCGLGAPVDHVQALSWEARMDALFWICPQEFMQHPTCTSLLTTTAGNETYSETLSGQESWKKMPETKLAVSLKGKLQKSFLFTLAASYMASTKRSATAKGGAKFHKVKQMSLAKYLESISASNVKNLDAGIPGSRSTPVQREELVQERSDNGKKGEGSATLERKFLQQVFQNEKHLQAMEPSRRALHSLQHARNLLCKMKNRAFVIGRDTSNKNRIKERQMSKAFQDQAGIEFWINQNEPDFISSGPQLSANELDVIEDEPSSFTLSQIVKGSRVGMVEKLRGVVIASTSLQASIRQSNSMKPTEVAESDINSTNSDSVPNKNKLLPAKEWSHKAGIGVLQQVDLETDSPSVSSSIMVNILKSRTSKVLSLCDLGLQVFPHVILSLDQLVRLNLSNNALQALPLNGLSNLKSLRSLVVNRNFLSEIPISASRLTNLAYLNIRSNQFSNIPKCIAAMPKLKAIDAGINPLCSLPRWFGNMASLSLIKFDGCHFSALPVGDSSALRNANSKTQTGSFYKKSTPVKSKTSLSTSEMPWKVISNIINLRRFNLGHNSLWHIELDKLCPRLAASLIDLRLHSTAISALPDSIGSLTSLLFLDISDNSIRHINPYLGVLTQLKTLKTKSNPIQSPPPSVCQNSTRMVIRWCDRTLAAKKSKNWDLRDISIDSLQFPSPDSLDAGTIKSINLSGCPLSHFALTNLPWKHLTSLVSLHIENCLGIKELPVDILFATRLRRLRVDGSGLESPPASILSSRGVAFARTYLTRVRDAKTHLLLDGLDLPFFPRSLLRGMSGIRHLSLIGNNISVLPADLPKAMPNLVTIDLSMNPLLSQVPISFASLDSLDQVAVQGTAMSGPVGRLFSAKKIQPALRLLRQCSQGKTTGHVDISLFQLPGWPDEVSQCAEAFSLDLSRNFIEIVPFAVSKMACLMYLDLSSNSLMSIHPIIASLESLKTLNLRNNINLEALPSSMHSMTRLEDVSCDGCPLRIPPLKTLQNGWSFAMNFLKKLHEVSEKGMLDFSRSGILSEEDILPVCKCVDPDAVTHVNLSYNPLRALGVDVLRQFTNLSSISVRGCSMLEVLPAELASLKLLASIDCAECEQLQLPPKEITACGSGRSKDMMSRVLHARETGFADFSLLPLKMLSSECVTLSNLTILDLRQTLIEELPASLCRASKLSDLRLGNFDDSSYRTFHHFCCPPPKVVQSGLQSIFRFLHRVDECSRQHKSKNAISAIKTNIDLSFSGIKTVPQEMRYGFMNHLVSINLRGCPISDIPDMTFRGMTCLESIDISLCFLLRQIPLSLVGLKSLQVLAASGCASLQLPPASIASSGLARIRTFFIQANLMPSSAYISSTSSDSPASVHCAKLPASADLFGLGLQSIPSILVHPQLLVLQGKSNPITWLPLELCNCSHLAELSFDSTPVFHRRLFPRMCTEELLDRLILSRRDSSNAITEIEALDPYSGEWQWPTASAIMSGKAAIVRQLRMIQELPFQHSNNLSIPMVINLSSQKCSCLPPQLLHLSSSFCSQVTCIDISDNYISVIPVGILACFPKLRLLDISNNRVRSLPIDFLLNPSLAIVHLLYHSLYSPEHQRKLAHSNDISAKAVAVTLPPASVVQLPSETEAIQDKLQVPIKILHSIFGVDLDNNPLDEPMRSAVMHKRHPLWIESASALLSYQDSAEDANVTLPLTSQDLVALQVWNNFICKVQSAFQSTLSISTVRLADMEDSQVPSYVVELLLSLYWLQCGRSLNRIVSEASDGSMPEDFEEVVLDPMQSQEFDIRFDSRPGSAADMLPNILGYNIMFWKAVSYGQNSSLFNGCEWLSLEKDGRSQRSEIFSSPKLSKLDASNLLHRSIPSNFLRCAAHSLVDVTFSYTPICRLPDISFCKVLRKIIADHCRLHTCDGRLPSSLLDCRLNDNALTALPFLQHLTKLREIRVFNNIIGAHKSADEDRFKIRPCKYNNMCPTCQEQSPDGKSETHQTSCCTDEINTLENMWGGCLNTIRMSHNRITSAMLKNLIQYCTKTRHLNISNNRLSCLPSNLGIMSNLETLLCCSSRITHIHSSIGRLGLLRQVDLRDNLLVSLPLSMGKLTNISSLSLAGNPLVLPPLSVIMSGAEQVISYLAEHAAQRGFSGALLPEESVRFGIFSSRGDEVKSRMIHCSNDNSGTLNLSGMALVEVPGEAMKASGVHGLQSLILSRNCISNIDGFLDIQDTLTQLLDLDLSENALESLDVNKEVIYYPHEEEEDMHKKQGRGVFPLSSICMRSMEGANFRMNQLQQVPIWLLEQCANLDRLDLSYNRISLLPNLFSLLANLKTLDISFNAIAALPQNLPKSLQHLFVQSNVLCDCSGGVASDCPYLKTLDLSNNQLTTVSTLQAVTSLEILRLANNSLDAQTLRALSGMSLLTELTLHDNRIDGPLPRVMFPAIAPLSTFSLSGNGFFRAIQLPLEQYEGVQRQIQARRLIRKAIDAANSSN